MATSLNSRLKCEFLRFSAGARNSSSQKLFILILVYVPALIGCWSLVGWITKNSYMIQISPTYVPMQFNTALCVLLTSIAATKYWVKRPIRTYICSGLALAITVLTLMQYLINRDLHIDQLFMEAYLTTSTSYPGRMAMSTGLCFILINLSLLLCASEWQGKKAKLCSLCLSTAVVGMSVISLIGYSANLTTAYGWGFTEMAVHTAFSFALLGSAITLNTFKYKVDPLDSQIFQRICLIVFGVTAIFLTNLALHAEENKRVGTVMEMTKGLLQLELEQQQENRDRFLTSIADMYSAEPNQNWVQRVDAFLASRPSMIAIQAAPIIGDAITITTPFRAVDAAELDSFENAKPLTSWNYDGIWYFKLFYNLRNELGTTDGNFYVLFSLDRFFERTTSRILATQFDITAEQNGQQIGSPPLVFEYTETFSQEILGSFWNISIHAKQLFIEQNKNLALYIITLLISIFVITLIALQHFYFKTRNKNDEVLKLNSRLAESLNAMLDSVLSSDEYGEILQVNDAALSCFGYERDELLGKNVRCLVGSEHADLHDDYLSKFRSNSLGDFLADERTLLAKAKDGSEIPVTIRIKESCDINNQRVFTAIIRDMTRIIKAEASKQETEAYLDTTMKSSCASWAIVDLKGNFHSVNQAMQDWLGYTEDELVGQSMLKIYPQEEHANSSKILCSLAMGHEESHTTERRYLSKRGQMLWGLASKSVVRLNENSSPEYIVYQIIDITVQKTLEEEMKTHILALERSNKELDQFAYVASHDLKSPLNAISKLATWIEEDCEDILPKESKKHFDLIKGRIARLANLLDDLLAYSRVGRLEDDADYVKVHELAQNILDLIGANHRFKLQASEFSIHVPIVPFELVMRNLISNVVKHHDIGSGVIQVNASVTDEGDKVTVEQDGPGIQENIREKAVVMFQTLKSRDETEGSGMGLAICKKAVEFYGGTLDIANSELGGTAIVMVWPVSYPKNTLTGATNGQGIAPFSN